MSGRRFPVTVAKNGRAPASLRSDLGPLQSNHLQAGLKTGDRVTAIVRPEVTRFVGRAADATSEAPNRIPARLVDRVAVGPSLRLRASAAGGQEFEAVADRSAADSIRPGDPVFVTFDAASLRTYREDGGAN